MLLWQAVVSVTGAASANAVAVTGTGRAMEADFSTLGISQDSTNVVVVAGCGRCWKMS